MGLEDDADAGAAGVTSCDAFDVLASPEQGRRAGHVLRKLVRRSPAARYPVPAAVQLQKGNALASWINIGTGRRQVSAVSVRKGGQEHSRFEGGGSLGVRR